jgi:sulfatase modifying factor 1
MRETRVWTPGTIALVVAMSAGCVAFDGLKESKDGYIGLGSSEQTCVAQTDSELCGEKTCGTLNDFDRCGTAREVKCGAACAGNVNPCDGVTCASPPATVCADATTRKVYNATGTCKSSGGSTSCDYGSTNSACTGGQSCSNGSCVAPTDPCAGTLCNAPPAASCVNASTRRVYPSTGTCSNGTCSYTPSDVACPAGASCSGGVCGCPSGLSECGGVCLSLATKENCGVCGRVCGSGQVCVAGNCAADNPLTARTASMVGDGLSNCGSAGNDVCARSLLVPGGTFYRGTDTANPATVSDFRLDKYEVTVGRFRKFVDAWVGGWRPTSGSGKHTHLNGGNGLFNTAGGYELGWDASWTAYVGAPKSDTVVPTGSGADTRNAWNSNLNCAANYATWSSTAGASEKRPTTCLSWYDLLAFCIWDGGFLPSEAEWEYVAAGGSEERVYPWGNAPPGTNTNVAVYGCHFNGSGAGTCTGLTNIATVGSASAGIARWGQLDMAGSAWEWNLDKYQTAYAPTCDNCTTFSTGSPRAIRGGSFFQDASSLPAASRISGIPAGRDAAVGGRCARTP